MPVVVIAGGSLAAPIGSSGEDRSSELIEPGGVESDDTVDGASVDSGDVGGGGAGAAGGGTGEGGGGGGGGDDGDGDPVAGVGSASPTAMAPIVPDR